MRVFAQVVETGSFTGAAQRLGISNALASKYVAQLEDRLNARLFNRTTRKVSPTEVGRAYYDKCIDIVERVDDLENAVQMQTGNPRGHLKISGPRILGEEELAHCISDFLAHHPQITVDMVLEERTVDIVAEGFDLAVRIGTLKDSSLIARRIAPYEYVLCATPGYLENAAPVRVPNDVVHHNCIINSVICPSNQWDFIIDGKRTSITVSPRARINAARPIRNMVLAGHGIGLCLLPNVEADIAEGRLIRLLEDYEAYDRDVYVVYPHSRHLAGKVRAFIDHAVLWFR